MPDKVLEQIEALKTVVTGIQTEYTEKSDKYGKDIADNDTSIKAMQEKFGTLSEDIQKLNDEKAASDKEVKDLQLVVARGQTKVGEDGEIPMSDEVKAAYADSVRIDKTAVNINKSVFIETVTEHVKHSFGHLTEESKDLLVKSIMAEGSQPSGGMFAPVPVDARIRNRVFETSPMRQMAEVINVNTLAMEFALNDEEIETAKAQEVTTRNPTGAIEFGKVRIPTSELYANPKATLQILEDSTVNIEGMLSGKVARKIARDQNKAFIVGDGNEEAKGILTYDDADVEVYERFKIGTMETAGSLTLAGDDLIDVQSHLLEEYQTNASWMMNRLIWAIITKLKDDEGQYLLNPAILFSGTTLQLLGATVRMAGDMPKPVAGTLVGGTNYIAYGDFREAYTILDRLGINVIMDNITQKGFVNWFFRTRYGGGVTNFQAFKRLKAKS